MKDFWANLTPTKKILLVLGIISILGIIAYFLFFRSKDTSKDGKTDSSTPRPADLVNSYSGDNFVHNPNINTQTVPAPRTPIKSTDPQMRELIMNMAMSLAGDPLRSADLRVEKSIGLNALTSLDLSVKLAMSTILTNLLKVDVEQPRSWVILSDEYSANGGTDFRRDIQDAVNKLKANNFDIRIRAWNIAPLQNGVNPPGTYSFAAEAKKSKMNNLTGLQMAKFFENVLGEIDRYNREIKNAVIQELRTANPPYRFSDYGDN